MKRLMSILGLSMVLSGASHSALAGIVVSDLNISSTSNSIALSWKTSEPVETHITFQNVNCTYLALCEVNYRVSSALTILHSVQIGSSVELAANTLYNIVLYSGATPYYSLQASTSGAPDPSTAPSIAFTKPLDQSVVAAGQYMLVQTHAISPIGVAKVDYTINGVKACASSMNSLDPVIYVSDNGCSILMPKSRGKSYRLDAIATDLAGAKFSAQPIYVITK